MRDGQEAEMTLNRSGILVVVLMLAGAVLALPVSACGPAPDALVGGLVARAVASASGGSLAGVRCISTADVAFCISPDTPPEKLEEVMRRLPAFVTPAYAAEIRWNRTASGKTGAQGNPITLTYSFVPDGTPLPTAVGEPEAASSLYAVLDAAFGGDRALWKAQFAWCFQRWSEVTGITYLEVSDDGAPVPSSPGVIGARGDIRFGSHNIDGATGVLGYSYYPDTADVILDSSENWGNPTRDYRYLRNTIMHEHGHGLGLGHVWPMNQTKLMEVTLWMGFEGPQDDDIRGGQRLYGDPNENDDTHQTATDLGVLTPTPVWAENLSTDSSTDADWFRFYAGPGRSLNVTVSPVGSTYMVGPSESTTVSVNTRSISDLQIQVFNTNGTTQLVLSNATPAGFDEVLSQYPLPAAGGTFFVRISPAAGGANDVQRYRASFSLAPVPPVINSVSVSPSLNAAGDAVTVTADVSAAQGVAGVTADGVALAGQEGGVWAGDISASAALGTHPVVVVARDVEGTETTDNSASYRTVRVLGIRIGDLSGLAADVSGDYLFRVWGRVVAPLTEDSFTLQAPGGEEVRVLAAGHGLTPGSFASVRGQLDPATTPPTIEAGASLITIF